MPPRKSSTAASRCALWLLNFDSAPSQYEFSSSGSCARGTYLNLLVCSPVAAQSITRIFGNCPGPRGTRDGFVIGFVMPRLDHRCISPLPEYGCSRTSEYACGTSLLLMNHHSPFVISSSDHNDLQQVRLEGTLRPALSHYKQPCCNPMPASLSAVPMSISKRKGKVRGAPAGVEPVLLARAAPLIPSLACARGGRHLLGMTVARARGLSTGSQFWRKCHLHERASAIAHGSLV